MTGIHTAQEYSETRATPLRDPCIILWAKAMAPPPNVPHVMSMVRFPPPGPGIAAEDA